MKRIRIDLTRTSLSGLFQSFIYSIGVYRRTFILATLATSVAAVLTILFPYLSQQVLDSLIAREPVGSHVQLLVMVAIGAWLTQATGLYLFSKLGEDITYRMRVDSMSSIVSTTMAALRHQKRGDLISRVSSDTAQAKSVSTTAFQQLLVGLISVMGATALMLFIDPLLFVVTVILIALPSYGTMRLLPIVRSASVAHRDNEGLLVNELERILGAFPTVKASVAESAELERVSSAANSSRRIGIRLGILNVLSTTTSGLVALGSFVVVLSIGALRVQGGHITIGGLVAFLLYAMQLSQPIVQITQSANLIQRSRSSLDRIQQLASLEVEDSLSSAAATPVRSEAFQLAAQFSNVSMSYSPDAPDVLKSLSLEIPKTGIMVLLGPSGSGKSTLFRLLIGLERPSAGTVFVDNKPVKGWVLSDLRRHVAFVEQETPVLDGTLRENLAYGSYDVSDQELLNSLEQVRLLERFQENNRILDTQLGHRGSDLSGGERQRIAVARALLRRPQLLLLDEATSQLDESNELHILELLRDIGKHSSVVFATHRKAALSIADTSVDLRQVSGQASPLSGHLVDKKTFVERE